MPEDQYGQEEAPVFVGPKQRYFHMTATVETVIAHKDTSIENSKRAVQQAFLKSVIGQKLIKADLKELTEAEYAEMFAVKRRAARDEQLAKDKEVANG